MLATVWNVLPALAVGAVLLAGCGEERSESTSTTTTKEISADAEEASVDAEEASEPPTRTKKTYTCTADEDCTVSCELPGDCCGQGCDCDAVYHVEEYDELRQANQAACTGEESCDQYRCPRSEFEKSARCRDARCELVRTPVGSRMENGFFMAEGAPDPLACTTPDECTGDTVSAEGGCCNDPYSLRAHSKSYAAWLYRWRTEDDRCSVVECPPPPNPSEPPDCAFEMRCVKGACADTCSQ
jgi:hypothetical protein